MKKVDPRTGLDILDRDECERLLAANVIGRLAIAVRGGAEIFPINYRFDGESLVFRTDVGTKLDAVGRAEVCFEIDEFDGEQHTGWSVIVHGRLEELHPRGGASAERALSLPVDPWATGSKGHWLRVIPSRITGRRVTLSH